MPTRLLLLCGALAAVLFIGTDIAAATLFYPGYDYSAQQVSELSAIGAPSRSFWVLMSTPYALLSLISATTVFGTPVDVTLSELALETFFPADAATGEVLRAIAQTQAAG